MFDKNYGLSSELKFKVYFLTVAFAFGLFKRLLDEFYLLDLDLSPSSLLKRPLLV